MGRQTDKHRAVIYCASIVARVAITTDRLKIKKKIMMDDNNAICIYILHIHCSNSSVEICTE